MKKYLLYGAVISVFVSGLALTTSAQIKLGGYKPAQIDDERVVAAANFAVSKRAETNTEQEGLTLDSIDKAEMQTVAGINYRLCMTVSLDEESQQVQAVVYQNLKQVYSLTSWTPVETCGEKESDSSDTADVKKKLFPLVTAGSWR